MLIIISVLFLYSTADSIEQYIAVNSLPLTLVGSSYRGVSVNDCIHNAIQAVSSL